MLTTTRKKPLKKISEITFDLEIINPIESKNLFGGCDYCSNGWNASNMNHYGPSENWLNTVTVYNNYQNPDFSYSNNWILNGGYSSDWDKANWGNDYDNNNYDPWVDPYVEPTPIDPEPVKLNNISDHICQMRSTQSLACSPMSFSYVANYYGADGLTSSDFAEMVGKDYNLMQEGAYGFNNGNMGTILNNVFNTTVLNDDDINSIIAQLNNGNPIIAGITQVNGGSHTVVIIGADASGGTLTYMDPTYGQQFTKNIDALNIFELYGINGVRNNAFVNQYKNDTNDTNCSICGH